MKKYPFLINNFLLLFLLFGCGAVISSEKVLIRFNQVGYLPYDSKIAVVMSRKPIKNLQFKIVSTRKTVYKGTLSQDYGAYLSFPHHYLVDFTAFQTEGTYKILVDHVRSNAFRIENSLYKPVVDSLLKFYNVQRCGPLSSEYHSPCHLNDVTTIVGDTTRTAQLDLTGGWHDAGDYRKFTLTTAHTTYLLLLCYQLFPQAFNDGNGNGLSDVLDEALIGIDWLKKAHFQNNQLITQVSDPKDDGRFWRLPENDLQPRIGYNRASKTHCSYVSATMALAGSVFRNVGRSDLANECIQRSKELFQLSQTNIPDFTSETDSAYVDRTYSDNLALAAVELYRVTREWNYYNIAKSILDTTAIVTWFSWGDLTALADARFAEFDRGSAERIANVLREFNETSKGNPYGYPLSIYPWGSASVQTGVAILSILYAKSTGSKEFLELATRQRDFLLGCNHYGITLITNIGYDFPKNPHHQISYFKKIPLPGAIMGGLISKDAYKPYRIRHEQTDRFAPFQTDSVVYYDDTQDFLTNEPTIGNNAQGLLMFAWWASQ